MISEDKLNKYSELISKYILKYRHTYGLSGRILLNIGNDTVILGEKVKKSLNNLGKLENVDLKTFVSYEDIGYLNLKSEKEQLLYIKSKTFDLAKKYDTIIKIVSTNQGLNDFTLPDKFKVRRSKELRTYFNHIEKLEEHKKFIYLRCYLFTEISAQFYKQNIQVLDETIVDALFLNEEDPFKEIEERRARMKILSEKLNSIKIRQLKIEGVNCNLNLDLNNSSRWVYSNLRNFPSYEIFTCPSKNSVNGEAKFNNPIFINGSEIRDAELKFKEGKVIEYSASSGIEELKNIVETRGGNYVGELGITDNLLSPIRNLSKCTMFDENISGEFGNFHIALGNSYSRCVKNSIGNTLLGNIHNKSQIHVDFINTQDFTINAKLRDGTNVILYKNGRFII